MDEFMGVEDQLRDVLRNNLRDPDSLEYDGYTKPVPFRKNGQTYWRIVMTYRAKNGFGGMNRGAVYGLYQQRQLKEWGEIK